MRLITAVPDGALRVPYFLQWSLALEQQFGNTGSLRVQYVGTRAVQLPYQVQVNGYQTVCAGCFAPLSLRASPKIRASEQSTSSATGANSHYNGLQLTGEKRVAHGLQVDANYTWSHCLDTVSNGGFLSFSSAGILSPLAGRTWPPVWRLRLRCPAQFQRDPTSTSCRCTRARAGSPR